MAMSEPQRIAARLTDGTDLAAAALLVSVPRRSGSPRGRVDRPVPDA